MSEKIKKFLDFNIRAVEGEPRTHWFKASTPDRDRMGDIIVQEGWKTQDFLKTGGPILWGHDYYSLPIGRGKEVSVSPDALEIKIEFQPEDVNPFAAQVERLVSGGWIKTGSVGFQVYRREPLSADDLKQRPDLKYGSRLYGDLLEFSIVPVPANPEALAQKDFASAFARGFGFKQNEAVSKLLPYRDQKGAVDARLLRASLAASFGARGGVKILDADIEACKNHLYRIANENNILVPSPSEIESLGSNLKSAFDDVWHAELLDVLAKAKDEESDVTFALIKGSTREKILATRDALNSILALSEQDSSKNNSMASETEELVKQFSEVNKNLSSVVARLK